MNDPYVIAFTGTRDGCTEVQKDLLEAFFSGIDPTSSVLMRNGVARGADIEALFIAGDTAPGVTFQTWPARSGDNRRLRRAIDKFGPDRFEHMVHLPPLTRNKRMVSGLPGNGVAGCDELIACPPSPAPTERYTSGAAKGGTWSTIEYAIREGVPVTMFVPDGEIVHVPDEWAYAPRDYFGNPE